MLTRNTHSRLLGRGILTAACIAAAGFLAACDSDVEGKKAQNAAAEAARMQQSAGEPRASDKLHSLVVEKGDGYTDLKNEIDRTSRDSSAQQKKYQEWITVQSSTKDLEAALEKLNKEAMPGATTPGTKAAFEAEAGGIQMQLAADRFAEVQPKMADLLTEAMIVEQLALSSLNDSREATSAGGAAGAPDPGGVRAAQDNLTAKRAAAADAKKHVDDIEKQIADKQDQARDIYAKTDQAFAAADQIKGKDAIPAGAKAMQDRAQGDQLTQDAALLEPDLIAAKSVLATALIQETDAEARLKTAQAWLANATSDASDYAKLRDNFASRARQLAGEDMMTHYKKMMELSAQLDAGLKTAADAARKAQEAYKIAGSSLSSAQSALSPKTMDLDSKDPLRATAEDKRPNALLGWHEAASAELLGRINTTSYLANAMANQAATVAAEAATAASVATDSMQHPAANNAKADASTAFGSAISAADAALKLSGSEVDKLKWIGYMIRASANQGLGVVNEESAVNNNAVKLGVHYAAAAADAAAALRNNPSLTALAGEVAPPR